MDRGWNAVGKLAARLQRPGRAALELIAKGSFNLTLSSWVGGLTSLRSLVRSHLCCRIGGVGWGALKLIQGSCRKVPMRRGLAADPPR